MLTVLNVAYPLAAVGPDATGGVEQIVSALDLGLVAAGHRSIVIAAAGSRTAGELVAPEPVSGILDESTVAQARARHAAALHAVLARTHVDVVHMHGVDFASYLPPPGPPVLATLHCPPGWYDDHALRPQRPRTWLNAVSARQHADLGASCRLLPPIENGVTIPPPRIGATGAFALTMSRIAPEKGIHIAIDAARSAAVALLIAGKVFDYPEHLRYFRAEIAPRLDSERRLIGEIGGARKRSLLSAALCLVVPSQVAETSSLAAREALAAGTPVIAYAAGALADTVDHGETGFLVRDVDEMASALREVTRIDRRRCREVAIRRFGRKPMIGSYLDLYATLAGGDGDMLSGKVPH